MSVPIEIQELCDAVQWPPNGVREGPASDSQIQAVESKMGLKLPSQMREFLQFLNGPCIGPGGIFGINTKRPYLDLAQYLSAHPYWRRNGWIPAAGDGCGNSYVLVCLADDDAPVAFIDMLSSKDEIAYLVASDYWHFLAFLLKKELRLTRWPFSEQEVLRDDPNLVHYRSVGPLPWDCD